MVDRVSDPDLHRVVIISALLRLAIDEVQIAVAVLDGTYLTPEIVSPPLYLAAASAVVRPPGMIVVGRNKSNVVLAVDRRHRRRAVTGDLLEYPTEARLRILTWINPWVVPCRCHLTIRTCDLYLRLAHPLLTLRLPQNCPRRLVAPLALRP